MRVREGSMYHLDSHNCFKSILVYDRKDLAISVLYYAYSLFYSVDLIPSLLINIIPNPVQYSKVLYGILYCVIGIVNFLL